MYTYIYTPFIAKRLIKKFFLKGSLRYDNATSCYIQ